MSTRDRHRTFEQRARHTRGAHGYALPLVLIFLTILAVSCIAALAALELSARTTGAVIARRQAFYECDNVSRAAGSVAREYLRNTSTPTDLDLKLAVCGDPLLCPLATSYADPAFTVDTMTAALSGAQLLGAVPNGPFQGTLARQNDVAIDVSLTKGATSDRCHVRQDSTVAEIKLSSFFVLVDGYGDFHSSTPLSVVGRTHVNGDVCARAAGAGPLAFTRLTSGGRLKVDACPRAAPPAGGGTTTIEDVSSTPQLIDATTDSGCLNCAATGRDWRAFALARWGGRAQDVDHGVPALRIPAGAGVAVASGGDAGGGSVDNTGTLRFLIEPARAGDPQDVRATRLAWLADIRILNGVWYKRDTGNPTSWPGIPIWSDHPVSFTSANEGGVEGTQSVGQTDLFAGAKPARYSHYVYDAGAQTLAAVNWAAPPVVSYGTLAFDGARLRPGFHTDACPAPVAGVAAVNVDVCASDAVQLVLGTRSGFTDARVAATDGARARILPINFDVEAFAAALADGGAGELGAHFAPGTFNGIVWIGVSWGGAHTVGGAPSLWPAVTSGAADANIPAAAGTAVGKLVDRLPYPLCGASGNDLVAASRIPACATTTRPNAVRIIHAADLSAFAGTGLTIASNGPVYLQGDFGQPGGGVGGENVTRAMIAGDALTVLSPGFSDAAHDWSAGAVVTAATGNVALAGALVVGHVPATAGVPGAGIENATRLMEDWGGRTLRLQGALAVGFASAFQRQPPAAVAVAPARVWVHDPLFAGAVSPLPPTPDLWAPPGMPSFIVQAVKNWQRD